jgi:ABC-2 type transport system ATP-binding protein
MVQRAALAFALLHEPELLILDEPMSGLDPIGRELVVNIIRDYHAKGNTILFCSHVLVDVERICDRICILDKGQIQALITPGELRNQESPPWTEKRQWNSPLEKYFHQTLKQEDDVESVA